MGLGAIPLMLANPYVRRICSFLDKVYIALLLLINQMINMSNKPKQPREFFTPIIEKIKANAEKIPELETLHIFGSIGEGKEMCGDIDLLLKVNFSFVESEIIKVQCGERDVPYKKCSEYPECCDDKRCKPDCVYNFGCSIQSWFDDLFLTEILDKIEKELYRGLTVNETNLIENITNYSRQEKNLSADEYLKLRFNDTKTRKLIQIK